MLRKIGIAAALLTAVVVFSGCGPSQIMRPPQDQIDAFLADNPELPERDKKCINEAFLEIGIRAETLRFMLGEPHSIEKVKQPWAHQELWRYRLGKTRVFIIEDGHVAGIEERVGKR
ncbi:MAG: hypothetical protein LBU70_11310 [Chitinispirillales bacterium]|jgi:hypothetical protein|nr:hypothetical protein [Chitinispirillales bacterium]